MLILSAADVRAALPMQAAIDTQRQAYTAVALGHAEMPLRTPVAVPEQQAVTLFMPARVAHDLGAKIVSVFPRNVSQGLPMIHGVVIIVDAATGRPEALLDATYLTALRTAAGVGAATDALARSDASVAALIGSGTLARTHLLAMCSIRSLQEVRVFSRQPANVADFVAEMQPLVSPRLLPVDASAEAIAGADIVCCVTTATSPVLDGNLLKPGAHVNGVGAYTLEMREIDLATARRAGAIFVDAREAVLAEAGDVVHALNEGALPDTQLIEIGLVLAGQHAGRPSDEAITLFKSCGIAAQDVCAAGEVVRRARQMGLGVEVGL